jgi:archaemetzincin
MEGIFLWWIGMAPADQALLESVRQEVAGAFEMPTVLWHAESRPSGTLDERRRQHSSTTMLRWLGAHRPAEARRLLGITDVDLFIPVLTFVYGEAQLGGHAAVVSTARLQPERTRVSPEALLHMRLVKECVHELGHTFGLRHCYEPGCVMGRAVNMASVDLKYPTLCAACRLQYLENLASQGEQS